MIFLGKHEVDIRITEDLQDEEDARSTDSTASSSSSESQAETVVLQAEGWVFLRARVQQDEGWVLIEGEGAAGWRVSVDRGWGLCRLKDECS